MPVSTQCPNCGKEYNLADEQAGLRVRCRECRREFEVPSHKPDRLEAVSQQPSRRQPLTAEEKETIHRAVTKPKTSRTWLYVGGGIAGVLLLLMLVCGGTLMLLLTQAQRTAKQVAAQLRAAEEEANRAKQAQANAEKKRQEAEKQLADAEMRARMVKVKEPEIDLNNLEALLGKLGPGQRAQLEKMIGNLGLSTKPIRDLDDALEKLKSKNIEDRRAAIGFITRSPRPRDGKKFQQVSDALDKFIREERDEGLRNAAETAKLIW